MKTISHNLLNLFRRYTAATVMNVIGLSVAFTAFLVLMMQVSYDWGFDKFHKETDNLFRLELKYTDGDAQATLSRPFIDAFIASSPHIKAGTLIQKWNNEQYVAVEQDGQRKGFKETYYTAYPSYPEVFDFTMKEGDRSALSSTDKVLIPESMALRFFGNQPATGKLLYGEGWNAEVGGVYRDFPANSLIANAIYKRIPDSEGTGIWDMQNYECYLLVDNPSNVADILVNFEQNFRHEQFSWEDKHLRMVNLPDVYYQTDVVFDAQLVKGSRTQVGVLFVIALLIILVAVINFTNFSNASVPVRVKNINTQKVLGCSTGTLRLFIISEAVLLCLLSFVLAVGTVWILSDTSLTHSISGGISLKAHSTLLFGTGVFALCIGLMAGCWPAWYITSFPPALVLKGNFGLSGKGRNLRNILAGVQFTVSFALIVTACFVSLQNNFMLHTPLGFEKDQVAIIKLTKKLSSDPQLLNQQLTQLPDIEKTCVASRVAGGGDQYSTWGRTYQGEQVFVRVIQGTPEILDVLGVKIIEGRDFLPEDLLTEGVYILNETARRTYNLETGNTLNLDWQDHHIRERIIGFMPDIKYNSCRNEMEPFGFFVANRSMAGSMDNALIRIRAGANYPALVADIQQKLTAIDPDYPLDIHLYDEILENLYQKEVNLGRQITFFSLIAILISLIGVFGIVLFESEYKRKEIGIRKVFGSTVREILIHLSQPYARILTACFILATPIAWYGVQKWLENFAYKTPVYWWVFALAFLIVTTITLATVSIQNWRAAITNPIDSIKTE